MFILKTDVWYVDKALLCLTQVAQQAFKKASGRYRLKLLTRESTHRQNKDEKEVED